MTPSFLRRFGAALLCSFGLTFASAPGAVATDAIDPAKPATGEAKPASDDPKPAPDKPTTGAKPAAGAAKPQADAAKPTSDGKPEMDAAKPAATAPKPAGELLPTSIQAKEEAEKEGRRHGARSKAGDGTLLVWDNVDSVWIAAESKNTYWVADTYYRFDEGIWLKSRLVSGPWELTASRFVPEAPRSRHGDPKQAVTATLPSGLEAIYEPRIRVFKIAGRQGVFLYDGAFYRYDGGVWLESGSPDGPWQHTSSVGLPPPLRRALASPEKGARVTLPSGEVLVSEGEPNLFAVEGKPDVLYFDGTFYERRTQKWFQSKTLGSGWEEISSQKIPGTVRSNYHQGTDKKAKGARKDGKSAKAGKAGEKKNAAAKKKAAAE